MTYCRVHRLDNGEILRIHVDSNPLPQATPPLQPSSAAQRIESEMATRIVGAEVWKVKCAITESGAVDSWPRCVHLGYAMGCVKNDDLNIDWDWEGMMQAF